MALFSSSLALQNLTTLKFKRAELPQKNYEYIDFKAYKDAGGTAISEDTWDRGDGKWLKHDRETGNQFWKNAMIAIIKNALSWQGRLQPFEQVSDFYHYAQVLVLYRKHTTQWLYGAYYLVNDLADMFDRKDIIQILEASLQVFIPGFILTQAVLDNFKALLSRLNLAIANYATTQFLRLLYTDFRNQPRIGALAWKFDKQFIMSEQIPTAFPVYSDSTLDVGIYLENIIFNNLGKISGFNLYVANELDLLYIPVYPSQYDSDLTDPTTRYGEKARVQVPLGLLYPNSFFYTDDTASDTPPFQAYSYALSTTVFGKTLKRGEMKYFNKQLSDPDVIIYQSYIKANKNILNVFKNSKNV